MILIDTHIWIWWVLEPARLQPAHQTIIEEHRAGIVGVSVISCWEVAKLVQLERLQLSRPVAQWIALALGYPGVRLLPLTPEVAVASTQLPDGFRSDPADEILVATARLHKCPLVTMDRKIRSYAHVQTI